MNPGEITIYAGQCVTKDTLVSVVKVLDINKFMEEYKEGFKN